jgi:hypothetical protein
MGRPAADRRLIAAFLTALTIHHSVDFRECLRTSRHAVDAKCAETSSGRGHDGGAAPSVSLSAVGVSRESVANASK